MDYLAAIGRSGALPSAVQGVTGMMKDISTLENLQTERAVSQERVRGMQQESRIREFTIKENEKKEEFLNRGWNPSLEPIYTMMNKEQQEKWMGRLKGSGFVNAQTGSGTQRDRINFTSVLESDKKMFQEFAEDLKMNLQVQATQLQTELSDATAKGNEKKIQELSGKLKGVKTQWETLAGKADWGLKQIDINQALKPFMTQPAPQGSNAPSMLDYLVAKYPNFQIALSIAQQTGDIGKLQETINKVVEIENRNVQFAPAGSQPYIGGEPVGEPIPPKPTSKIIKEQEVDPKTGNTYEQTYNVDEQGNKTPMGMPRVVKQAKEEKPEYTTKQARYRISQIDLSIARIKQSGTIDVGTAIKNPLLAGLVDTKDPEAVKQAIRSLEEEKEYISQFLPSTGKTKTPELIPSHGANEPKTVYVYEGGKLIRK
uniref:Uncharacterized protein n=1 Tax=viral metagenome TaxID=1070528 RepID=A0A6M3L658_9ZZZZ